MKTKKTKAQKPKFSKAQVARAQKIVNDIAEGIDCKETPAQLRTSLDYYADELMRTQQELGQLKGRQAMMKLGWELIDRGFRNA